MNKKVLVVTPFATHPHNRGNRLRIYQLLENLKKLGCEVWLLHVLWDSSEADVEAMQRHFGKRCISRPLNAKRISFRWRLVNKLGKHLKLMQAMNNKLDDWYDRSLDAVLDDLRERVKPDCVIAQYVFFSRALERFGSEVRKVIDTHDLFADRNKLVYSQDPGLKNGSWYSISPREEKKGLERADIVIAIDELSAAQFKRYVDRPVVVIGHTVSITPRRESTAVQRILFVGSASGLNRAAAEYFIEKVFPRVRAKLPEAIFDVAGDVGSLIQVPIPPGVNILGRVAELEPLYARSTLAVNPMLSGTGLPIKTIEALGFGKPVVATPLGARGIDENTAVAVADSPEAFASAVIKILTDSKYAAEMSESAAAYAELNNATVLKKLAALVGEGEDAFP